MTEQAERLEQFFAQFLNNDGSYAGCVNLYETLADFRDKLARHLEAIALGRLPQEEPVLFSRMSGLPFLTAAVADSIPYSRRQNSLGWWVGASLTFVIAMLISAYIWLYTTIEARHERQMNRALFEQNRFMTLAASGSPGGINAALAEYQTLKAREVLKSPDIWSWWTWAETERVNEIALMG